MKDDSVEGPRGHAGTPGPAGKESPLGFWGLSFRSQHTEISDALFVAALRIRKDIKWLGMNAQRMVALAQLERLLLEYVDRTTIDSVYSYSDGLNCPKPNY